MASHYPEKVEVFRGILRTGERLRREMRQLFEGSGLTPRGYRVLSRIPDGGTTLKGLSEAVGMEPANLSVMIEKLVREKLVLREPSVEDRRSVLIRPTALGRRRWKAMEGPYRATVERLVSGLNGAERERLLALLGRVAQPVETEEKG